MKTRIAQLWMAALGALVAASAGAAQGVIYACSDSAGNTVLTDTRTGERCEPVTSAASATGNEAAPTKAQPGSDDAARPADQQPAASTESAAAKPAPEAELPPMETRLQRYRESMLRGASDDMDAPQSARNRAVSRRYLMMNRSTYQALQQ